MTRTTREPLSPDEQRAIQRHLHSAEGAHLLCRRKACRRARACRLDESCASRLYGLAGTSPVDGELMALRLAYLLELAGHWQRLPRRPVGAPSGRPPRRRAG